MVLKLSSFKITDMQCYLLFLLSPIELPCKIWIEKKFVIDNEMKVSVPFETFLIGVVKKLHVQHINPYEVSKKITSIFDQDILQNPHINLIFNENHSITSITSASADLLSSETSSSWSRFLIYNLGSGVMPSTFTMI